MLRVELAPEILDDFDRIITHLREYEARDPAARIVEIVRAIDVLRDNPCIGRIGKDGLRELIIGRDSHGYVALYRHLAEIDTVIMLAICSQREAGYGHI